MNIHLRQSILNQMTEAQAVLKGHFRNFTLKANSLIRKLKENALNNWETL